MPASFTLIVELHFPGGSFREQAGLAQAGGRHKEHQSGLPADRSLWRPAERCALSPAGRATTISWLRTDMLSSVQMARPPHNLGVGSRAIERSKITPPRGG